MIWRQFFRRIMQWFGFECYLFRRRIFIEDALKFVFEHEEAGIRASYDNFARSLNLPPKCARRIFSQLVHSGLAQELDDSISLTDTGRREALRIVRLHRLWEKYLAEETDLDPSQWHAKAHVLEHMTSQEAADSLVARLGNPRFDPHGDPIPTEAGEIRSVSGVALPTAQPGDIVEVSHLEDEPVSVFRELLDRGLHLGAQLQIETSSAEGVTVRHHGETVTLSPQASQNVHVKLISKKDLRFWQKKPKTLADLGLGEEGTVTGLSPACRGLARRRLLDLGFVPGTRVRAELCSVGGDPMAFRVRNTLIALRKTQAALILIDMEKSVPR
jgi:DtxR family Mn-dependent transcriptional regulator